MMKIFLFDTETTGLPVCSGCNVSLQPKVIEFYGVTLLWDGDTFRRGEEVNCLINPRERLSQTIIRITGIRDADLVGKPEWPEVRKDILGHLLQADIVLAHNVSFDLQMIEFEEKRLGNRPPAIRRPMCLVEETEYLFGMRLSLTNLHTELFGKGFEAHRAHADVEAMEKCFVELVKTRRVQL